MSPVSFSRRPVDLSALEAHVRLVKPRGAVERDDSRKRTVSIPKDALVPIVQPDLGAAVSTDVYRYRLLLPIAHIVRKAAGKVQRVIVAKAEDLEHIQQTFIRHFGGATVQLQQPSPIRGIGARDPDDVAGTAEENEHAVFEVFAAPIHASDEYFRAVRRELEDALGEGVILIERQRVTLI